mgnify:CR=1 FL=1
MPLFTVFRDFIMIMWWLKVFCITCIIYCFSIVDLYCRLLQSAVTLRRQWIKWLTHQQRPRATWLWVGSTRVRGWSSPRADWDRWTCGNWTPIMGGGTDTHLITCISIYRYTSVLPVLVLLISQSVISVEDKEILVFAYHMFID